MRKVLSNKLFMATFISDMISNFGDVLYYLALMNYVLVLPDTKLALAMITVSETLPILLGLFVGIWADKTRNKIDTILGTLLVRVGLYVVVGVVIGFSPALWIVAVICLINFLSDLSGQYENYLYLPVSLRVVSNEDREASMAFRMSVGSLLRIGFQATGAILIGVMSYQQLAFFNAGTFLVSLMILLVLRPTFQRLLKENPIKQSTDIQTETGLICSMKQTLKESYLAVQNIPILKVSILTIAGLNAIFTALSPLLVLNMKESSQFIFINTATTIAMLSILLAIGSILGSGLATSLFKDVSLTRLLLISTVMPIVLFIGFIAQNIYIVLTVVFAVSILIGIFNPKISALVMNELPEDKLATIESGITTFCQIGMVVGQFSVSAMVVFVSARFISLVFLLLAILLFVYSVSKMGKL